MEKTKKRGHNKAEKIENRKETRTQKEVGKGCMGLNDKGKDKKRGENKAEKIGNRKGKRTQKKRWERGVWGRVRREKTKKKGKIKQDQIIRKQNREEATEKEVGKGCMG